MSGLDGDFVILFFLTGDFLVDAERLLNLVFIGDAFETLLVLALASFSADFSHCLMEFLTPFNVLQEEQGSLVQGLDSVRSRMLIAMYRPH